MKIELKLIEVEQKSVFLNLYQFYIHDMSLFFAKEMGLRGLFDFDKTQFDKYWQSVDHWPYFIYVDSKIAGFCLVRRYPFNKQMWDIEQFFVLNRYKRRGVGAATLSELVSLYPGSWQVRVLPNNTPALNFWERSIASLADYKKMIQPESGEDIYFFHFEFSVDHST